MYRKAIVLQLSQKVHIAIVTRQLVLPFIKFDPGSFENPHTVMKFLACWTIIEVYSLDWIKLFMQPVSMTKTVLLDHVN